MHYKGQNTGIDIDNAIPSESYDEDEYFEFTIEGKNTYTEKDIWYEIDLVYGDAPVDRTIRLRDDLLKFTLFEKVGEDGEETKILDAVSYESINNTKIWVNKIDKNTTEETKITYKLYMWISNRLTIGRDYTAEEWNSNVYASVKVNVKGDFNEKVADEPKEEEPDVGTMITTILDKAYTNSKELIALDVTDKNNVTKCASLEACAEKTIEYRYSGPEVNNYIYLKDNNNSNELWRIIGIFEDETAGQYVKIVRDEVLPESYLPVTFKASDGNSYAIKGSEVNAYWNRFEPHLEDISEEKNNWSTAGLQYWLNAEEDDTEGNKNYLSYLSGDVKKQLVSVKHYLGTVHTDSVGYVEDTPKEAYKHERDVESCAGGKGSSSDPKSENSGCHVWSENDATWTGKVSLMYPSDYGLSATDTNWTTKLGANSGINFSTGSVNETTWAFSTMSDAKTNSSWLLSPTSFSASYTPGWISSGNVGANIVYGNGSVRPVLNLSSQTSIVGDGDGTKSKPYEIIAD